MKEHRGFEYDRHYDIYHQYRQMIAQITAIENKLITEEQYQEIKRHSSLYKAKDEDMSSLNDQMKDVP